jgi:hypothetical protein
LNQNKARELLEKTIKAFQEVKITREKIDSNVIYCYPLLMSNKLLLIQYLYDFQVDGYMIIRLKDITSIRSDDLERFSESIIKNEGIIENIKNPSFETIEDWLEVFKKLKSMGNNIIIECETIDNSEFYIGEIIDINKKSVSLLNFDGIGEWDEEPTKINYSDITSISFGKRYINIISKYVKPKNKETCTWMTSVSSFNCGRVTESNT